MCSKFRKRAQLYLTSRVMIRKMTSEAPHQASIKQFNTLMNEGEIDFFSEKE